ncbi:hypothetical protein BV133_2797 [Blastochloris viridis]|uniref:Uncharacterized protein n=1 Tax=Blastochloris viridis TaxID=1079 RepID=A0A182D4G8_BLAVI|nr:hypothetical protein BV133_2797 [Blastochloris viridis]
MGVWREVGAGCKHDVRDGEQLSGGCHAGGLHRFTRGFETLAKLAERGRPTVRM